MEFHHRIDGFYDGSFMLKLKAAAVFFVFFSERKYQKMWIHVKHAVCSTSSALNIIRLVLNIVVKPGQDSTTLRPAIRECGRNIFCS